MPSTSKELQDKFGPNEYKAEQVLLSFGARIKDAGWIVIPKHIDEAHGREYPEFWDAVQFLIEEWDYAIYEEEEKQPNAESISRFFLYACIVIGVAWLLFYIFS